MRNNTIENLQVHSHMVAVIAHALAVIRQNVFGRSSNPGLAVQIALFHDSSEIFTGDMPTPIKYYDPEIMEAYKKVESVAMRKLLTALPFELRPVYKEILSPDAEGEVYALVKAADSLAAYIKCIEELNTGNTEFRLAAKQCKAKLDSMDLEEVGYFFDNFMPAFELTLDELDFSIE